MRLVSKRCMQVVDSMATRLTCNRDGGSDLPLPFSVLNRCKKIEYIRCLSIGSLEGCPIGLKTLHISDGSSLGSLGPLAVCSELEILDIGGISPISDLSPLSPCTKLKSLIITDARVSDLSPLSSLVLLKILDLSLNGGIKDLSPLHQCPDIEELLLSDLPLIKDLSLFETGFPKLRDLEISRLPVNDLSPLTKLQNLEEIHCTDIPRSTSLLPLARCGKLKKIHCLAYAKDIDELKEMRPEVIVIEDRDEEDYDDYLDYDDYHGSYEEDGHNGDEYGPY